LRIADYEQGSSEAKKVALLFDEVFDPSPALPKGKGELSLQGAHCVS